MVDSEKVVICSLINKPCKYSTPTYFDLGIYENCRLCEIYRTEWFKINDGKRTYK